MNQADIIRQRYAELNSLYKAKGGDRVAEPSKIRIEVDLRNGVGSYTFPIKKGDIQNAREVSLDRNDVFVPNFWGIFPAVQSTTKPSTMILASYPFINDGVHPSIHEAGFKKTDIEAMYNGQVQWLMDNTVLISSYPSENFRQVPRTQGQVLLKSDDNAILPGVESQWDIKEACAFLTPRMIVAGTRDHKVTLNFDASGLDFGCTEGYAPKLVFYMDGFLIKGGAEYFSQENPLSMAVGQWG